MRELKQLVVPISETWIDWGIEGQSRRCMIAEATKEKYPKLKNIRATRDYLRATDPKRNVIYTFPMSAHARTMLLLFDEGNRAALKPFVVRLRKPIIRERVKRVYQGKDTVNRKKGREYNSPVAGQRAAKNHLGALPQRSRVDRVFGEKLYGGELAKLRESLGVPPSIPLTPVTT